MSQPLPYGMKYASSEYATLVWLPVGPAAIHSLPDVMPNTQFIHSPVCRSRTMLRMFPEAAA